MASMKWYHIALVIACIAVGAGIGVFLHRAYHLTIWLAPLIAVANGVSVYYALKRKFDAKGS